MKGNLSPKTAASEAAANYQCVIPASAQLHRKHRAFIRQVISKFPIIPQALDNISSTFGGIFTGAAAFWHPRECFCHFVCVALSFKPHG